MAQGLFRDDDGNLDDRRIAGWILLGVVIALSYSGGFRGSAQAVELVRILVWPAIALMAGTVAEKFGKKGAQ